MRPPPFTGINPDQNWGLSESHYCQQSLISYREVDFNIHANVSASSSSSICAYRYPASVRACRRGIGHRVQHTAPLWLLMAKTFMWSIDKQLTSQSKMSSFYKAYVVDTVCKIPDGLAASVFAFGNHGVEKKPKTTASKANHQKCLPTWDKVYRKSANIGLLLHCHSHVDKKC